MIMILCGVDKEGCAIFCMTFVKCVCASCFPRLNCNHNCALRFFYFVVAKLMREDKE